MRFYFYNILILLFLSVSYKAQAAEPAIPVAFKGVYEFGMPGVPFGKMGIELSQDPSNYNVTTDITLTGIAKVFSKHLSHSVVVASGKDFSYSDIQYESNYQTKKKKRHAKLSYKQGVLVEDVVEPADPRRPKVPADLKNKSADPLSFLLRMREQLSAALASKSNAFSLHIYDGRRLTKANFTVDTSQRAIQYKGKKQPVIMVAVKREPVSGFTPSELEDISAKEPPLYIYFSKDERLIPLKLEITMWFGYLTAQLTKECSAGESCLLGLK